MTPGRPPRRSLNPVGRVRVPHEASGSAWKPALAGLTGILRLLDILITDV